MGHDTFLNPWNLVKHPREKIWLYTGINHAKVFFFGQFKAKLCLVEVLEISYSQYFNDDCN